MSRPETGVHFLHEKTRTGHMPKVNVIIPWAWCLCAWCISCLAQGSWRRHADGCI